MSGRRILIVEDDVIFAKNLTEILGELGYEVVGNTAKGEDAIHIALESQPDLVLMDIELRGDIDGIEAADIIRAKTEIPVIYLTAFSDSATLDGAKVTQPFGYLIKPTSKSLLHSAIEMALYRAEMDKLLRDSHRKLDLALHGANLGLLDWNLVNGEVMANVGASKILGYSDTELVFDSVTWEELIHPEDLPMVTQALENHLSGRLVIFEVEFRIRTDSNEWKWVYARGKICEYSITHKPTRMLGTFLDITQRKRTEEELQKAKMELEIRVEQRTAALRESEERFRKIFETAQDSIFLKDAHLKYTHVNPAMLNLLDASEFEIIGKTDDQIWPDKEAGYIGNLENRVVEGQPIEAQYSLTTKTGTVNLQCSRVPLQDENGTVIGLCGICRDVTDYYGKTREIRLISKGYSSAVMQEVLKKIGLAAEVDSTVLLLGESGSGKDYFARHLHDTSLRKGGPFLTINCAALPPDLVESELFGHEAGSFTGARTRRRGLLELAEGGTIVLNEIGDMPNHIQAKLLTFLDSNSITRVGGEKNVEIDARLIAATNQNLQDLVRKGIFREDLFHRLNVFTITIPPLRDRLDDVPGLAQELLSKLSKKLNRSEVPYLDGAAIERLSNYSWPGNVRELKNVLERAMIIQRNPCILSENLTLEGMSLTVEQTNEANGFTLTLTVGEGASMQNVLEEARNTLVTSALQRTNGNVSAAARLLGVSRDVLRHVVKTRDVDI